MNERTIRRLTSEDIGAYMDIYLNCYPAGKDLSGECWNKYAARHIRSMTEFSHVNYFGLFEDGTLAAVMKLIDFDMNLYGEMRKATGLMALGVHPLYKKRGVARDMVRYFEDYTLRSGATVAMLLPFRMDFYKKMGYGCGTKLEEYRICTDYLPECRDRSHLRYLGTGTIDAVLDCHRRFAERYHGQLYKFEEEVRDMRADDEVRRIGYYEGDDLRGYAAFTFVNTSETNYTINTLDVKELVYDDPDVLRELLGGLRLQSDLAQTVVLRTGEPDFYHLLQSPQDVSDNYIDFGFLQTNIAAVGTMYKVVDVAGFLRDAAHCTFPPIDLTVGFTVYAELTDETMEFAIRFAEGRWSYVEAPEAVDVSAQCCLSDLSALLMGCAELGGLVRLGVVTLDKPAYTALLDSLFHVPQKPFTNTDY